jgi:hypothetical protein
VQADVGGWVLERPSNHVFCEQARHHYRCRLNVSILQVMNGRNVCFLAHPDVVGVKHDHLFAWWKFKSVSPRCRVLLRMGLDHEGQKKKQIAKVEEMSAWERFVCDNRAKVDGRGIGSNYARESCAI